MNRYRPIPALARSALIPLGAIVAAIAWWGLALPYPIVLALALPFLGLFLVIPFWIARKKKSFEAALTAQLVQGKPGRLIQALERDHFFRLFAPPAQWHGLMAIAQSERKKWPEAETHYRRAIDGYAQKAPPQLHLGLADALFESDQKSESIPHYEIALKWDPTLDRAQENLKRAKKSRQS